MQSEIDDIIENTSNEYPCREKLIRKLYHLIGCNIDEDNAVPPAIHIFGPNNTGKTVILRKFLEECSSTFVYIDCIECYTSRILFEMIIDGLCDYERSSKNNFASLMKCDNGRDFVDALTEHLSNDKIYIICLDNAEKLRDMDAHILPLLTRLSELTGYLRICCIFVSMIPPENMIPTSGVGSDLMPFYWPQYKEPEYLKILLSFYEDFKEFLCYHLKATSQFSDFQRAWDMLNQFIDKEFFEQYLKLFLNVFLKNCREIDVLLRISRQCFIKYCDPVLQRTITKNDIKNLFANINGTFKAALNTSYQTMNLYSELDVATNMMSAASLSQSSVRPAGTTTAASTATAYQFELPYYGKFLLIAAYLASHNESKLDKRLFMKNHGKKRKQLKAIIKNAKVSEKLSTQLGPKSFNLDRLLAIFYAILDDKVSLSCTLLAQISSLVHLKLLTFVSGENNIMDGTARLQCTVSLEFIRRIGSSVGFNVCQYLSDFI